jgi:S1-C subfamily serine protease
VRDSGILGPEAETMSAQWMAISNELAKAADDAGTHTVAVHSEPRGSSSGVIWRPGVIVTAEHALRRDEEIQVTLSGGTVASAKLAGRDRSTDLAALKCPEATRAAAIGDSLSLKVGNLALVVGRTRASGPIAALAFVSLVVEERRLWGGTALAPYLRLDVALQRTGVGGAVIDANGVVVGIATPRFSPGGAVALPVATVNRVVHALLEKGRISRGYLGVGLQPVRLPENLRQVLKREGKSAAMVLEVETNGPAHNAGVVIGDILVALAGKPVMRLEDVQAHLHEENIGQAISAEFLRGGEKHAANIIVGERPNGGD